MVECGQRDLKFEAWDFSWRLEFGCWMLDVGIFKHSSHSIPSLDTHQIAHRVPAINAAVGKDRRSPALAPNDLGAGTLGVSLRRGVGNDEFAFVENHKLAVRRHQPAAAEVRLRPLPFARVEIDTGERCRAMRGA